MSDFRAWSVEELALEHAERRERHGDAFAAVESGYGDREANTRERDAAFKACGETATELRSRGFVLRHDDSVPVWAPV